MVEGAYTHLHAYLCLRNSTPEPTAQEVAALSGRELEAQSREHCECNVYYANLAAWSLLPTPHQEVHVSYSLLMVKQGRNTPHCPLNPQITSSQATQNHTFELLLSLKNFSLKTAAFYSRRIGGCIISQILLLQPGRKSRWGMGSFTKKTFHSCSTVNPLQQCKPEVIFA